MKGNYLGFFERASEIYNGAGGYCTLVKAIDSEKLKDGLNQREYEIAVSILSDFFEERNGSGSKRIFGIHEHEIKCLVKKCEQMENPNTPLREA